MKSSKERKKQQRLRRCVAELTNLARETAPIVEVRELAPCEDEDVVLEICVPTGFEEQIGEALYERRFDMFLNEGVFVSLQVLPDEELMAVERREE